ncbi:MAG: lysine transporter LysE [Ponticaulis sp.]|nr:lysine transporter LysE [Ponticaulis sp.]
MNGVDFIPFLLAAFAIELTPGPNMFYIALLSAQNGRKPGYAVVAGVALGLLSVGVLSLLGFSVLVANNPWVYEILRWGGIAYLLWLALDAVLDSRKTLESEPAATVMREAFLRGLIANLLNPKAFLFYLTLLPSFIGSDTHYTQWFIVLMVVYVGIATLIHLVIVVMSGSVSGLLSHKDYREKVGWGFAGLLVCVAIWIAFKTAR